MGICYVFKDSKITKDDGTLIKRGVHYGWGATPDDSNVSENNKGLSQAISSQNVDGNLIGLNRNPLLFCPQKNYSIPSDYNQQNPYSAAGIFNPILYSEGAHVGVYTEYYRFYPNAQDDSFYFRIKIQTDYSNHSASVAVHMVRPSANLNKYCFSMVTSFNFYTNGGVGYATVLGCFLPWKYYIRNGDNVIPTVGCAVYRGTVKYPFQGTGAVELPQPYTTNIEVGIGSSFNEESTWEIFTQGYTPDSYDEDNPYFNGGVSEEGGGEGNFSEESDNPEADSLPSLSAAGTGFATIFKPNAAQLRALSDLFWNSNVFTFLQNLVENITDMFTSLAIVPFEVLEGTTVSVTWLGIDTAVSLTLAARQYYEFDMGSIDMANDSRIFTSGSVLDYSPFSKLGIYLPFIGYQELDIDECRDAVINLRYRIDILSGACVAILKVGGRDLYQFTGNCLTQIPITNESMQSLVSDAVNVGIAAAGVGATGASVGADLAEAASSKSGIEFGDIANAHRSITKAESGLASATVNAVIGSKPTFNKSGAVSSSASMMSVKQPYLFLSTPRQSIPDHYQRYRGFPSNITSKLGDLSGFTVVEDIRLNGLVATSPEVAEIYDLLKKGVII